MRTWIGLLGLALALLGLAVVADGWRPDNRIQSWTRRGEGAEVLARLEEAYGGDEFVLLRVEHGGDAGAIGWADEVGLQARAVPAVARVVNPLRLPGSTDAEPVSTSAGAGSTDAGAGSTAAGAQAARARLDAALARPLVKELGLASGAHVDVVLALHAHASPEERAALARFVEERRAEGRAAGHELLAAGHPLLAAALDEEAARVDRDFAPLLVVLAVVALALLQRSVPLALVACLPAALASVGTRAALVAIGWPSNLVLVAVGPLVFVIVLAAGLHYVAAFRRWVDAGATCEQAASAGLRDVGRAAALAALTTSVGFGVFVVSDVEAVRRLGLAAAGGIAVGTPVAYACLRALLPGVRLAPRRDVHTHPLAQLARRAEGRRGVVAVLAVLVTAAAVHGVRGLRVETNALDYFPTDHPLRDAFARLEASGAGLSAFEVLVEGVDATAQSRGELGARLDALDPARPVFGPELVRRDLEHVAGFGAGLALPSVLRDTGRAARAGEPGARWTVFLPTTDAATTRAIAAEARAAAREVAPDARVRLGGSLLGALDMQAALLATLGTSLALTALVSGLLFLFVTRSARTWLAAAFVNAFPVAVVALLDRVTIARLDASTVMVAAVVLGLAVDNTLHLVAAFEHGGRRAAFAKVAEPAFLGGAALALGFAGLAFSGFAPTAHFGLLVAAGVAAAVVADFVLLPALLRR